MDDSGWYDIPVLVGMNQTHKTAYDLLDLESQLIAWIKIANQSVVTLWLAR